ncbi:MAG: LysR family transcriptional regulator [Bdellovibrionota bacterium]
MQHLNYSHLRYFWVVAQTGSVTLAARRLHLTQPSISAQLKQFEQILGEKLFERRGRGLVLTEKGQLAYRYANQIFSLGDELLHTLHGGEGRLPSTLKVGVADVVPKSLAYRLIEPGLKIDSGCLLTCVEDKTERLLADLSISELDLVIADRPIPPNVRVRAYNHFIGECPVVFLGTAQLKKRYTPHFPRSLSDAPLLLPTTESSVRFELERWFHEIGIRPEPIAEIQDRALLKIAARDGRGLVPIPAVVESEVRKEYGLERVGVADAVMERLYIITIERRIKNPVSLQIVSEARNKLFGEPKRSARSK